MQQAQAEQIIALELFTKTINSCEKLISKVSEKNKYELCHLDAINKSLKESFDFITDVLQRVVDEYYHAYYEVKAFVQFTSKNDIDWQVAENLETVNAAKKLIKFIG